MKLKSLKFVLPILLVLPSLAFADYHYQRKPEGIEILSPITIYFKWNDWDNDICGGNNLCISNGAYFNIHFRASPEDYWASNVYEKTETKKEFTNVVWIPIGTKVYAVDFWIYDEHKNYITTGRTLESGNPAFIINGEIIGGRMENWLDIEEILGYIGKLAEDIPGYIALMMGLPIAFWFVEKTIAFVRGNFRPVEKIKEE
jgi:hypothetical protein